MANDGIKNLKPMNKTNRSHNLSKNKNSKRIDYNPIIKAPIKGI